MFRYERPQKGRFRQFNQAGVELLGFEEGSSDLEIISIVCDIIIELELEDAVLRINHLGDKDTKEKFLSEIAIKLGNPIIKPSLFLGRINPALSGKLNVKL